VDVSVAGSSDFFIGSASVVQAVSFPTSGARMKFCDAIVFGGEVAKKGSPLTGTAAESDTHSDSMSIGWVYVSGPSNWIQPCAQVGVGTGAIGLKNAARSLNASAWAGAPHTAAVAGAALSIVAYSE
jgi:hypothetical protein